MRANCLMFVEQLARRWRHDTLARGWRAGTARPTPQQILDAVVGLYCLERVGVSAPKLKDDVVRAAGRNACPSVLRCVSALGEAGTSSPTP